MGAKTTSVTPSQDSFFKYGKLRKFHLFTIYHCVVAQEMRMLGYFAAQTSPLILLVLSMDNFDHTAHSAAFMLKMVLYLILPENRTFVSVSKVKLAKVTIYIIYTVQNIPPFPLKCLKLTNKLLS